MNLLILSLLMAFGGHGHPQCSVLLSGPMTISGVEIPNFCIGPGMDITSLNTEEGTILLYVNALGEHVKCMHSECLNVPVPKPYPLWRMEAQKSERTFTSGATRDIDPGPMLNQIPTVCLVGKDKPDFCASYQPIDVPAVQEPSKEPPNGPMCMVSPCGHQYTKWCEGGGMRGDMIVAEICSDKPPLEWSCADKSRSLESSVDGLKHWCHRMSQ